MNDLCSIDLHKNRAYVCRIILDSKLLEEIHFVRGNL